MSDFAERMRALRQRFIGEATSEAAAIETHAAVEVWSEVRDLSHRLAGRAGMFGFPELSDLARELEEAIEAGVPSPELQRLASGLGCRLRAIEN